LLAPALCNDYAQAKCATPLPYAVTAKGYCAFTWATGLGAPRAIVVASNNDVIVVDQRGNRVLVLWETSSGVQQAVLTSGNGLNHAVKIDGKYLYASSPTNVYRWPYTPGTRTNLGTAEVVIKNVPCCHHTTRSLEFDANGFLYVQSGSGANVDPDSSHAQIRKFDVSKIAAGGNDWTTGELFADGLRNEVGIRFDNAGQLWGVENGVDDLNRPDLGGDIHQDNPSEEINYFAKPGLFYGYPYCWSEGILANNKSHPSGTQWAHPNFMNDGKHTDAWCQTPANVQPPAYNLPAHTAPLDILFYYGAVFPNAKGNAFVSLHGSWDRTVKQGYSVVQVNFDGTRPTSSIDFLAYQGPGATGPNWAHRPVGLALYQCGGNTECLLVSSDASGVIIAIIVDS